MTDFVPVLLPKAGMNMVEATVIEWLKSEGDEVDQGDALCEVETDKVEMEVESPVTGTIVQILVAADEDAQVGDVLAQIRPAESGAENG